MNGYQMNKDIKKAMNYVEESYKNGNIGKLTYEYFMKLFLSFHIENKLDKSLLRLSNKINDKINKWNDKYGRF